MGLAWLKLVVLAFCLHLRIACASLVLMMRAADRALMGPDPGLIAGAVTKIGGKTLGEIEFSFQGAIGGDPQGVRAYVAAYRELSARILDAVRELHPGLDGTAVEAPWIRAVLEREAMGAPFTVWARMLGTGRGVAVTIVARLREMLPGAEPLQAPPEGRFTEWDFDEAAMARFYRAVLEELERPEGPLERIRKVLGISRTELAHLFGVRRQALDQWSARGVPGDRQEKLATLGEISDLLAAKLKADRIPGVVRRTATAYDGRTALAAIADGDEERVLAELRDAFDWAGVA
jgi:DNA-binding transcriptional regulator YiaG